MTSTYFPHAVCEDCKWTQMYHAGNLRASRDHAMHHAQTTGHAVRMKHQHEFADLLWTEAFMGQAYGDGAVEAWVATLPPSAVTLLRAYRDGLLSLTACEAQYTCTCEACVEARRRATAEEHAR